MKFKNLLSLTLFVVIAASSATAQTAARNDAWGNYQTAAARQTPDDSAAQPIKFRKFQNFFGFYGQGVKTSRDQTSNFFRTGNRLKSVYGFANSSDFFLNEKFGITLDTSSTFAKKKNVRFAAGTFDAARATSGDISQNKFDILVGPKFRAPVAKRFVPFAYALAGAEINRTKIDTALGKRSQTAADFALAVGGGFDIPVNSRFSVRPVQIDYNPVFQRRRTNFFDTGRNIGKSRVDQMRVGFGIVINF